MTPSITDVKSAVEWYEGEELLYPERTLINLATAYIEGRVVEKCDHEERDMLMVGCPWCELELANKRIEYLESKQLISTTDIEEIVKTIFSKHFPIRKDYCECGTCRKVAYEEIAQALVGKVAKPFEPNGIDNDGNPIQYGLSGGTAKPLPLDIKERYCICGHHNVRHEDIEDGSIGGLWGAGACTLCRCRCFELRSGKIEQGEE